MKEIAVVDHPGNDLVLPDVPPASLHDQIRNELRAYDEQYPGGPDGMAAWWAMHSILHGDPDRSYMDRIALVRIVLDVM